MLPSERIGGYRVVRKLATGAMTDVVLASAEGPHGFSRTVVLKRLLAPYKDDERFTRSFAREAAAYAKLDDPRIVTLHDFLTLDGGDLVMVLEHVDGVPLERVRELVVDDTIAIHIGAEIFAALAVAHTSGEALVHRDVNPSNVLLAWNGHVKLADFGLVKPTRALASTAKYESIAPLLGTTSPYFAPEQARGEKVTPAADVYSAALVVWELLARSRTASIDDAAVRPDLDTHVRDSLRVALSMQPSERTATAASIAKTFASIVGPVDGRERIAELLAKVRHDVAPPDGSVVIPKAPPVPRPASTRLRAVKASIPKPPSVPRMAAVKPPSTPRMAAVKPPSTPKMPAVKPPSAPKMEAVKPVEPPPAVVAAPIVEIRESRRPPPSFTELPVVQKPLVLDFRQPSVPDADSIEAELRTRMADVAVEAPPAVEAAPVVLPPPADPLPSVAYDEDDEELDDEEIDDQPIVIPGIGLVTPPKSGGRRWGLRCLVAAAVIGALVLYAHRTNRVHIAHIDTAGRWVRAHIESEPPPPTPEPPQPAPPPAVEKAAAVAPVAPPAEPEPAPARTSDVGTIKTTAAAPWRRIFVDDKTMGQTPETVQVPCGTHTVKLGSGGHAQSIDVPCGGEIEVGDR